MESIVVWTNGSLHYWEWPISTDFRNKHFFFSWSRVELPPDFTVKLTVL